MKIGKKRNWIKSSMAYRAVEGLVICILINALTLVTFTELIKSGKIQENKIDYAVGIILLISSFAGNIKAQIKCKKKRLWIFSFITLGYAMVLITVNAFFCEGMYSGIGTMILMVLCGGIAAIILCLNDIKGSENRKTKNSYR